MTKKKETTNLDSEAFPLCTVNQMEGGRNKIKGTSQFFLQIVVPISYQM